MLLKGAVHRVMDNIKKMNIKEYINVEAAKLLLVYALILVAALLTN
jgi:hypothetical protein